MGGFLFRDGSASVRSQYTRGAADCQTDGRGRAVGDGAKFLAACRAANRSAGNLSQKPDAGAGRRRSWQRLPFLARNELCSPCVSRWDVDHAR